jgi:hypothetical protein
VWSAGTSGIKKKYISRTKLMSLQRTVRTRINESKRGYQPRGNSVKDENGDLFADSYNILNRWKYYVPQLLNVHRG